MTIHEANANALYYGMQRQQKCPKCQKAMRSYFECFCGTPYLMWYCRDCGWNKGRADKWIKKKTEVQCQ